MVMSKDKMSNYEVLHFHTLQKIAFFAVFRADSPISGDI